MTMLMEPPAQAGAASQAEMHHVDVARVEHGRCSPVRHVAFVLDPSRLRGVHRELAARLRRDAGIRVTLVRGRAGNAPPGTVDLLLDLERLVYRLRGPRLGDRLDFAQLALEDLPVGEEPDLVVDLCGDGSAAAKAQSIRLAYDGVCGETALIGALVAGRMPTIELEDARTGIIVGRGVPCADNAETISDALECALAKVVTLVTAAARGRTTLAPERRLPPQAARLHKAVMSELAALKVAIVRRLYRLCFYAPHWRTCWRLLDGPDLWTTGTLAGTSWNVVPDPGFRFYADPFPLLHEGKTYVFVEDFDHRCGKAVISVIPFDRNGPTGPARPVLEEPWHLSYPFVFVHAGQVWMIPESVANKSVELYRADPFPDRWVREATLISGIEASDATVTRHGGTFWMFAATREGAGSWSDTLSLFSAPDLLGPWTPHPLNPLLVDQRGVRPAGAMVVRGGKLWRPVQDGADGYGTGIALAEVIALDHERFVQEIHGSLRADPRWPGRRFHTLNRAGSLELIDGSAYSPRNRTLARWLETWSGRREEPIDRST